MNVVNTYIKIMYIEKVKRVFPTNNNMHEF